MANNNEVDVLIVGAGPAGLMLATWLARLNIKTKIVDKRSVKVLSGQADGVQCRTVEVFQSFGFAHRLVEEGAHINEVVFWNPTEDGTGIMRTRRTPDNSPGTSRFPHAVLTQGRIERFLLDAMKDFNNLTVNRSVAPTSMVIDEALTNDYSPSSYPITVTLRHLSEEESTPTQVGAAPSGLYRSNILSDDEADVMAGKSVFEAAGEEETVKAKFVVGCDGARSWVRKQIGLSLNGDSANSVWGVLDAIITDCDFPDIRLKCTVHSKDAGSILVVPREKDLVRFYVQIGSTKPGERVDRAAISPESIIATAQRIFSPYKLTFKHIDWWTVYEVGQRLTDSFTPETHNRVLIAGDAAHTHSPKAGQGMNTSMMDTYSLGWKLAAVLRGQAVPALIDTYSEERHKVAQELIDLDYQLSRMFSAKPKGEGEEGEGVSLQEFKEFFIKMGKWASGTAVHYLPNLVVAEEKATSLAPGLPHGERFASHQVVALADARPWHLGDRFVSDGRWRIVFFAGDVREPVQRQKLERVAEYFDLPSGPLRLYTPAGEDLDSLIELITVISNPRITVEPNDFPEILWPKKNPWGSRAYDKLYADDSSPVTPDQRGEIYKNLQIAPEGCLVVVRPDQTVSLVCGLEEPQQIGAFFSRFLIPENQTQQ
ncbi:hypothetical protein JCM6882_008543 [Rhodosporidiobolus microsporus]